MADVESPATGTDPDDLYRSAVEAYGAALERLAKGYEPDSDRCRDLLQEIHVALWRSLSGFNGRCSLRTWTYRVAHNTATSKVSRRRSKVRALVSLDTVAEGFLEEEPELRIDRSRALERLFAWIRRLKPIDRQVILLYLEGLDRSSIGEITGLTSGNVATKIHRIKSVLRRRSSEGGWNFD